MFFSKLGNSIDPDEVPPRLLIEKSEFPVSHDTVDYIFIKIIQYL